MDSQYKDIYEKLEALEWLMRKERMKGAHGPAAFAGPARGQARVLAMLKIQPEMTAKDLSYLLGIRQQSLNELLKKLENGGYIKRKPSEKDRRIMLIYLTEKGKEFQQPQDEFPDLFESFTQEELIQFEAYLDRLIEILQSRQAGDEELDAARREEWLENARGRMGDQQLDRLFAMCQRAFGPMGGHRGPAGGPAPFHGPHHGPHEFGPRDFGPDDSCPEGFGPQRRGSKACRPGFGFEDFKCPDFRPEREWHAGFGSEEGRPGCWNAEGDGHQPGFDSFERPPFGPDSRFCSNDKAANQAEGQEKPDQPDADSSNND